MNGGLWLCQRHIRADLVEKEFGKKVGQYFIREQRALLAKGNYLQMLQSVLTPTFGSK